MLTTAKWGVNRPCSGAKREWMSLWSPRIARATLGGGRRRDRTTVARAVTPASAVRRRNLARLLRPRHLAFVGGDDVAAAIRSSRCNGFAGTLSVVHPKRAEIEGVRCVPTVADLTMPPDAVFVAVPREATIETVAALSARGAGGAVCYASGFAEAGEEGRAAQARLRLRSKRECARGER